MAGLSAIVDATGISAPTYAEILASLQASYRAIYGADVYLEPDSQDGQFLGVIALAIKNANDMAIDVYNSFSPSSAQGAGLSSVVKVNGIRRLVPTNSTVVVTLVGQALTVINDGFVRDNLNLGTTWVLPPSVTIPLSGQIDVTATCTTQGAIVADVGVITEIATPVPGWQTVTNSAPAIPGAPVESDAILRRRQSKSASFPAATTLNGIYAAVANITGVLRSTVYQNDTNITNDRGIPAHNIAVVAEGGDIAAVAQAVAQKKPPGIPTFGTTTVTVVDAFGVPSTININDLFLADASVLVFIEPLLNYVTTTTTRIKESLALYVSTLDIGEISYLNRLLAPANLNGDAATEATSFTQQDLDTLARTFNITAVAQTRFDMFITDGPRSAGATSFAIHDATNIALGDIIYLPLTDLSYFRTMVTSVTGLTVTFAPGIPPGKTLANNTLIYVMDDLQCAFNEGFRLLSANITAINSQTNVTMAG